MTTVTKEKDVCLLYAVGKLIKALDSLDDDIESNKLDEARSIALGVKKYLEADNDDRN